LIQENGITVRSGGDFPRQEAGDGEIQEENPVNILYKL
jgi:hypothetical protein